MALRAGRIVLLNALPAERAAVIGAFSFVLDAVKVDAEVGPDCPIFRHVFLRDVHLLNVLDDLEVAFISPVGNRREVHGSHRVFVLAELVLVNRRHTRLEIRADVEGAVVFVDLEAAQQEGFVLDAAVEVLLEVPHRRVDLHLAHGVAHHYRLLFVGLLVALCLDLGGSPHFLHSCS